MARVRGAGGARAARGVASRARAGVAARGVVRVPVAAPARLDAAAVAQPALRLALAVLQPTRVPVHANLNEITIKLLI